MDAIGSDLKGAWRAIASAPWSSAAAVVTIALGIAANVAVSVVAYGVLLRPLPYTRADRLVLISTRDSRGDESDFRLPEARAWIDRLRTVRGAAAYVTENVTIRGAGEPVAMDAALVEGPLFDVLGTPPAAGRPSLSDPADVVVGAALADRIRTVHPAVIGAGLTVGSRPLTVVAVMPPAFDFPTSHTQLWMPAENAPPLALFGRPDDRSFTLMARLAGGVSLSQMRVDADRVARDTNGRFGPVVKGRRAAIEPFEDRLFGDVRPMLRVFVAGGLLVLLIACANVATVLIGRAAARDREFAVRIALGAGRARLLRTFLAESALIAAAGAIAGVWLARFAVATVQSELASLLPHAATLGLDGPVVAWSIAVTAAVAIACGLAPAANVWRDRMQPLRGMTATATPGGRRLRTSLVAIQIALAVVLLAGASLLGRTFVRLAWNDIGIDSGHTVAASLQLGETTRFDSASREPFVRELLRRTAALPGVRAAGLGGGLPPASSVLEVGISTGRGDPIFMMNLVPTTPGYLEAIGARLERGRTFERADVDSKRHVVVISDRVARRFFPNRDPIGRTFPVTFPGQTAKAVIVGLVHDIKYTGLDRPRDASLFLPWTDLPSSVMYLAVKGDGDPAALAPIVRRVISQADPTLPVGDVKPLSAVMSRELVPGRLRAIAAGGFAAVAILVSLLGLAGSLTRAVVERRRELAIRAALGSTPGRTMRLVFAQAARIVLAGFALGIPLALLAGRALSHLLFGVTAADPLTFLAVPLATGLAAAAACYLPARRAAAISPVEWLRQ
ncbi:MAG TPA: ADOP family duplicated permease [Vicinamibacterales bacterium]|nr:ADOP family duplicated permease [Vicinamibacterales bacterium]